MSTRRQTSVIWTTALLASLALVTSACAQVDRVAAPASENPADLPCRHALTDEAALAAGGPSALLAERGTPGDTTDALHYDLEVEALFASQSLIGRNTMTIRSLVDGLSSFEFRLDNNFTITSLTCNGTPVSSLRLDPATVRVTLDRAYNTDETFDLAVSYNGAVDEFQGFGSIRFTTHAGAPIVSTLSEPYYAYTWFPNKDDNRDKVTADLAFIVPNSLVVASNGVQLGVDALSGNRARYRFRMDYPIATYLICFSATNYNTFSGVYNHAGGSMPLEFYIYPESDTPVNRDSWLNTSQMLATFAPLYGEYPFLDAKYGIYQFPFSGGMEHQTMTGQGTFNESVTAHELGHQWWGDLVTCATWSDIWLNEGFATYSEALWYENRPGANAQADLYNAMQVRKPFSTNGSVYVYDTTNIGRIFSSDFSYRKAGWVLHMLRHVVGDETFFNILASYRASFAYDAATTDEFRLVCEGEYGDDLTWFFDQWIYEIGAPDYRYAWRSVNVGSNRYVEVYLRQVQPSGEPTFIMPIDLEATVPLGNNQRSVVWNVAREQHFLIPAGGQVQGVTLDPGGWLLYDNLSTTSFVEGPPKIVTTLPSPDAAVARVNAPTVQVTFHKAVNASPAAFTLNGDVFGAISTSFLYDAGTNTVTLTPTTPLKPDTYTLTVAETITDTAAGKQLDGEVVDGVLPSGDGLPGGGAVVRFTIGPAGDLTGDGVVDLSDLGVLFGGWGGPAGDLDGDGDTNLADLGVLFGAWGSTLR